MIGLFIVGKARAIAEIKEVLKLNLSSLSKPELKTTVEEFQNALKGRNNKTTTQITLTFRMGVIPFHRFGAGFHPFSKGCSYGLI